MSVDFARPDVANLVFHLFGRSVHPELFTVYAKAELRHQNYAAIIRICDAGHILSFRHKEQVLSEVTTTRRYLGRGFGRGAAPGSDSGSSVNRWIHLMSAFTGSCPALRAGPASATATIPLSTRLAKSSCP